MSIFFVLLPLAICIAVVGLLAFIWAVRAGQYDDVDTPAYRMLVDEESSGDNEKENEL